MKFAIRGPGGKGRTTPKLIVSFKRLISQGVLEPGCRLPAERELAKRFGVNRATLRQVLKVLEIMGVLSQRIGDGTYLNTSAAAILDEPMRFLILMDDISQHELLEARLIVEPELAARAAERASEEDLDGLRQAISALEKSRTRQARIKADLAFHECIFRAAGNRVCHLIFTVVHKSIFNSMAQLSVRSDPKSPLSHHKAIYAAIHARDPEEARRRAHAHLLDAQALLVSPKRNQLRASSPS